MSYNPEFMTAKSSVQNPIGRFRQVVVHVQ